jgi:glycosyltransferase involved in cell wall biosynthesis
MKAQLPISNPCISVIIPCYNHGHFLPEAIESVLAQSYGPMEIVVVDDGSTDNTRQVAARYPEVKYVYKENAGLSAARNTGIEKSTGEFLVFLDADDWLYKEAVEINLKYLMREEDAAFVSGAFDRVYTEDKLSEEKKREVTADHYLHLLQSNYIGVPAAVMYRRWVFKDILYDTTPPNSCSDYDIYLRIARRFPVIHHTEKIAAYRIHGSSMSANDVSMLENVLKVLENQKSLLKTKEEREALESGRKIWKEYYCKEIYLKLRKGKIASSNVILFTLLKFRPKYFAKYLLAEKYHALKSIFSQ